MKNEILLSCLSSNFAYFCSKTHRFRENAILKDHFRIDVFSSDNFHQRRAQTSVYTAFTRKGAPKMLGKNIRVPRRKNAVASLTQTFTMSTKSLAGKGKKFRGFTNLFRNANARNTKPPETEAVKKPFAGFTEAYKNFKPPEYDEYEYEDEDEDAVSFITPVVPEEMKKVKVEYKHFVPTRYNEWRDERLEVAQEKEQAAGPTAEKRTAGIDGSEMGDGPRPRPPFGGAAEPKGVGFVGDLDDIFRTQLAPFRDLNEYPMKYQLRKVNDRMKRFLAVTEERDGYSDTDSHSSHACSEVAPKMNTNDAHRRQLKEYFGRNVTYCRTKPIDFRRQRFHDWYSKFTFDYERKYKNMPDVSHSLYPEDFGSWYERVSEKVENKYKNVPENVTRQNIMVTHTYLGDGHRPQQITIDNADASLGGTFPSLSHCETCREI